MKQTSIKLKTLGDYRDFCAGLGVEKAVAYFDDKIAEQGRDMIVVTDEKQMVTLIGSILLLGSIAQ